MRPNVDKRRFGEDTVETLYECDCGCKQQVTLYTDDDGDVWMHVVSYPANLWQVIKWWWNERRVYRADLLVRASDIITMRNQLNNHIEKQINKVLHP